MSNDMTDAFAFAMANLKTLGADEPTELWNIVDHHPHIYGRFVVKAQYHHIIQKIMDGLTNVLSRHVGLVSFEIAINQTPPIVCLWFDTRNTHYYDNREIERYVQSKFGLHCSAWHNEPNTIRISVWQEIPPEYVKIFQRMEDEWLDKRSSV